MLPVLGASTMGRTTQGSPSIVVLPPDEGAVLSEIASVKSAVLFGKGVSAVVSFPHKVLLVDAASNLHPFFTHRLDAGHIHLATIAHAFNYWVAMLRDGVRSATRVGRSRRAEGRILEDTDVPWGHQVAVMFQIVSALALEVPAFLQSIENLLMYNYPVNHGDMWTIVAGVVLRTVQVLMFMACPSCPRSVYLCRNWRMYQSLLREVVRG